MVQGLKEICEVLQQGDVSSFELIHSGMVAALLDLFSEPGSETFVHNAKIILQVFAGVDVVSTIPHNHLLTRDIDINDIIERFIIAVLFPTVTQRLRTAEWTVYRW